MTIEIKKLTPELTGDFFDFFDTRAFSDHAEWSCCYCTFFHVDGEMENKIDEAVKACGGGVDVLRRHVKDTAAKLMAGGVLQGYLAYSGGVPIGWCNVNDKSAFRRFDFDAHVTEFIRAHDSGRARAVTCFLIAPEFRRKGAASLLLERAAADAETDGYAAIEGYPRKRDKREEFDYYGPVRIFENAGFVNISEKYDVAIMRREF